MAAAKVYRSSTTQSIPELVRRLPCRVRPDAPVLKQVSLHQAIEARKLAVEDVERLLQHPEDLKRLDALVEDYSVKHQVFVRLLSLVIHINNLGYTCDEAAGQQTPAECYRLYSG